MRRALLTIAVLAGTLAPDVALAQRQGESAKRGENRARIEADLRRGFSRAVREQLGLDDEEMRRLAVVTQRYAQERRTLHREEEGARDALRRLTRDSAPDSAAVSAALRRWLDVQRKRVALLEGEQRELAVFLTPIQRAKFMALQEQVRRRVERRRRGGNDDRDDGRSERSR